jgi:hypothetical protein
MDTDNKGANMNIGKLIRLYFQLNADAMNYTPLSHRGMRAARLMPIVRARIEVSK